MGFFGLLMMGAMALFWVALLAVGIWALVRWARRTPTVAAPERGPQPPALAPSALDVLRERYARGEIDAETFGAMASRLLASERRDKQP
ncbi:MAG TPA: SHOCT domain-containing protein [Ktedonobacterales bacterium]|nr:SHOCT domain-containing protein [Ktedonobacterales bacterium]